MSRRGVGHLPGIAARNRTGPVLSAEGPQAFSPPRLQAADEYMAVREKPTHGKDLIQQYWEEVLARVGQVYGLHPH